MCGRFALFSTGSQLSQALGLPLQVRQLKPRYNVAPGTFIAVVHRPEGDASLVMEEMWWGFKPYWAGEKAPQPINATVEKVASSNYFRGAFAHHRCLIPADGWYEWLAVGGKKQPYFLCREDREPVWLAGIWTERADGTRGCAIITEPARGAAKEIHSRMPLALDAGSLGPWLDPHLTDREALRQIVRHLDAKLITCWPVSIRVNRPGNDEDAGLINPA
ncbi:SOS response-associated peptidase [Halomonas korlensis]|uniref:Abasic site processing protein n=1 Tax=Halomonas korlensis TaxID=463301 RepID=A0A1I7FY17_9GAMM|nr:SOS response-associated peptidase [Halomonas korlensis]SFU41104.1 Putative SOS response-associated peptidase YedK [Halomonas korlensis]